ncbi:MAG: DUF2141 domain-containing protein [Saprospiraceae bacterium]|nr:DUF2141 domain-containing protein [Lewinella sp.]
MYYHLLISLLAGVLSAGFNIGAPDDGVLHLKVSNIEEARGWIWVGVYDSKENFLIKEKAIVEGKEVADTGSLEMIVDHVRYGNCAVAVFHDINGNGEMDRNWLGIPTEPYAFSRKPRSKWRLPRFDEVAFDFAPRQSNLSVTLDKW